MLDYLHLPDNTNGSIDYFPGFSNTDGGSWVVWEKPRGAHMIRITCIAGGGGGGSGFSSNTTTNRGGGGGGGSSTISIVTLPAYVLPDRLYVSSGVGGAGGAANPADGTANLGSDGVRSYVCIAQDTGVIYRVCYTDSGKAGTTPPDAVPTGGTGGSGGTATTTADIPLASYGIRSFINAAGGTGGGANGAGTGTNYPTTGLLLSGGTGGNGGTAITTGNTILAPTQTEYNIFSSPVSSGGSGVVGGLGREIYQPLLSTGATGGMANSGTGAGGDGGPGGFGSGGGGGGAGGAGAAGGGGKGGNGLIIIHSW